MQDAVRVHAMNLANEATAKHTREHLRSLCGSEHGDDESDDEDGFIVMMEFTDIVVAMMIVVVAVAIGGSDSGC